MPGIKTDRKWLPLSLAQKTIWLESKLNRQTILQLGGWAKIEGDLDVLMAKRAAALVMARHDALRLRVDDEQPRQWLESLCEVPLSIVDLPLSDDPDESFKEHVESAFASPLHFGDHALFQITIARKSLDLCYMLWRFHHIVADSVSTTAAMRYWSEAYLALTSDEPLELTARSSYVDTIKNDTEYLQSESYKRDLDYWVKRFDPLPPVLISSLLISGNTVNTANFYSDHIFKGRQLDQLQDLAGRLGVSSARIIFVLFALTVADRYQEMDVVAGLALHKRDKVTRLALGMFSGVLPVRYRFNLEEGLSAAVQRFSSQVDQDLRHQRLPVDDLARARELFRSGRSRLFDIVMSYLPAECAHTEGLSQKFPVTSDIVSMHEASPISLHITQLEDKLKLRVAVNPYILEGDEAEAMNRILHRTLDVAVNNSACAIKDLLSMICEEHAIVSDIGAQETESEEWII